MAKIVYGICALTSFLCSGLLIRGYLQHKSSFLFWSAVAFLGFACNNALLYVDLAILPKEIDLSLIRNWIAVFSIAVLLYAFIWEKP